MPETLSSIGAIMRLGGVRRPGRALSIALCGRSVSLMPMLLALPLWLHYAFVFSCGMCCGIAMTMQRSIMQEWVPATHQSPIMAAYSRRPWEARHSAPC